MLYYIPIFTWHWCCASLACNFLPPTYSLSRGLVWHSFFFQSHCSLPVATNRLNNTFRWQTHASAVLFNTNGWIQSGPRLLLSFSLLRHFKTASSFNVNVIQDNILQITNRTMSHNSQYSSVLWLRYSNYNNIVGWVLVTLEQFPSCSIALLPCYTVSSHGMRNW